MMEASSSRDNVARCAGVRSRSRSATESSSSGRIWSLVSVPTTSLSGSITRRKDAVLRRSMRALLSVSGAAIVMPLP